MSLAAYNRNWEKYNNDMVKKWWYKRDISYSWLFKLFETDLEKIASGMSYPALCLEKNNNKKTTKNSLHGFDV